MSGAVSYRALWAYGALGLPLAFAALPIYVHVPKLYGDTLGLPLTTVGAVLLASRLADALIDPWLGGVSDQYGQRRRLIAVALPLLLLGLVALLHPPAGAGGGWLAASLGVVYVGYSLASINYYAWGAEIPAGPHERTRLTATREGCALLGVILAAALPGVLAPDFPTGLSRMAGVFAVLLVAAAVITLRYAPPGPVVPAARLGVGTMVRSAMRDHRFMRLLGVFAINGIASAIPATLVLFFVKDVLALESASGLFLVVYFAAGVLALPLWLRLARAWGKAQAWCASMVLSVLVFAWAGTLGAGDFWPFVLVCACSGMALGADLALPPSLLADVLAARAGEPTQSGAYFGVWNFVTKLNLALAAGLTLPVLEWSGYTPGSVTETGVFALVLAYAVLPLGLKGAAAVAVWRARRAFTV